MDNVGVTALFRIVPAYNGKTYQVKKYANTTNKALDVGGVVQNVSTLSKLNKQINNKSAFTERIKIWCDFIRAGTNDINTGTLTSSSWYIVPITCEPGQHFLYSFYQQLAFEYVEQTTVRIYFTNMDDEILTMDTDTPAYITFDF